jgi:hypothetical protein
MFGRLDLVKNQTGLAEAENFWTLPHGPVQNRPGTDYVLEAKDSTKLTVGVPFIYSTTQAYVLEFGDFYVRFHTLGGTVLEAAKTITAVSSPAGLITSAAHGFSNGNWVFLDTIVGPTALNGRFAVVSDSAANTFRIKDFAGNYITTGSYPAYVSGGTASRVYEIASPYAVADLLSLHFTQSADVLTITHPGYQQRELRRSGATSWAFATLSFTPTQAAPTGPSTVAAPTSGAVSYVYVVTAVAADGLEESLKSAETAAVNNDLTVAANRNTISWTGATGAVRYNVYKKQNGLYGYIGQASGLSFVDNNITADTTKTPPEQNDPFSGATNWPAAVGYHQGRRWFGGTTTKPQNLYATRSGTESNMSYSIPTRDDDSINARLVSRQAQTIRHIVPLRDLIVLTSGGAWKVFAASSDVITPSSIFPRMESSIGASNVQPVVTDDAVIYAQDRGGRVRHLKIAQAYTSNYSAEDLSIMAPHLFVGYTITSMAWTTGPLPMVWMTRSDGVLLAMTYVPEQQVIAWHTHTTDGTFEQVCVIPEGNEDVPYVYVKRTINGRTVRALEKLHTRTFATPADSYFVDCGLTYSGTATTTITGLWHLEGKSVAILADAAVHPRRTVVNGSVTLEAAASKVQVGLPIRARFKTLPVSIDGAQAAGQGTMKNLNGAFLRVNASSGIWAGPDYDKLKQFAQRTTEAYGSPPDQVTGEVQLVLTPSWSMGGQVCVEQTDPLPVTILSMVLDIAIGG